MKLDKACVAARAGAIAVAAMLTGCQSDDVSGNEKTYQAQTYCLSSQPNNSFESREAACGYYQSHFVQSSVGTPEGFFRYLAATKNLCDMNRSECMKYWTAVSEDSVLTKSYPGIDVRDPRIWAAKRATVAACMDDSHPVTPDGQDAKPEVCLQAARLLRGDRVAPRTLREVEHRACDLGEPDECHYATMDGEVVDVKASEAVQAARRQHKTGP
jgi:hypothetical protein